MYIIYIHILYILHIKTSKQTQSSSRRASAFKDSSALLNILVVNFTKSEVFLITSILLVVKAKNIYWNTTKM